MILLWDLSKNACKNQTAKKLEKLGASKIMKIAKGTRGIIYTGQLKGKKIAIKIKKPISKVIDTITKEAKWLSLLNKHKIGPKLIFCDDEIIVYKFTDGPVIKEYLQKCNKLQRKKILTELLKQCALMDKLGINKEEMHHPTKNIIVLKGKPVLIDFERAHKSIKPQNVTQFVQ